MYMFKILISIRLKKPNSVTLFPVNNFVYTLYSIECGSDAKLCVVLVIINCI